MDKEQDDNEDLAEEDDLEEGEWEDEDSEDEEERESARESLTAILLQVREQMHLNLEVLWDQWAFIREATLEVENYPATPEEIALLQQIATAAAHLRDMTDRNEPYDSDSIRAWYIPSMLLLELWDDPTAALEMSMVRESGWEPSQ